MIKPKDLQSIVETAQQAKAQGDSLLLGQHMTALYQVLHPHVLSTIKYALTPPLPSSEEIEDTASDVWVAVHRRLETYDPEKSQVKTWVCTIARNKAIDLSRLRQRNQKRYTSLDNSGEGETSMYNLIPDTKNIDPSQQILDEIESSEMRQAAIKVMHKMRDERLFDEWCEYIENDDRTHEDIAQGLREKGQDDATYKMIESRFRRLRKKFETLIREELAQGE